MKVIVLLADGFEECEALIVVDLLRRAGIETIMASVMERMEVDSSRHIKLLADVLAEKVNFEDADLLFLPGGRLGTENLWKSELVKQQCLYFAKNKQVAAICAAPSILAELSLLNGKKATCHPDYEDKIQGAILTKQSVTVSENIITGQGLGATFPFAFELIKILVGGEKARQIQKAICYQEREKC